ncbi:MAG: DNA polymerase III subunit epsilon [Psittacicella sp.]
MTRQIFLDTETTGMLRNSKTPSKGHRVIEIGCVEMIDRKLTNKTFHVMLNPEQEISEGAIKVHGITNEEVQDAPKFQEVCSEFLEFIKGAELLIHNAPFDVDFLNNEFSILRAKGGLEEDIKVGDICTVTDTLQIARDKNPGKKNTLDALCNKFGVDLSRRVKHGALLDSELLAEVYLNLTSGQTSILDVNEYNYSLRDTSQNSASAYTLTGFDFLGDTKLEAVSKEQEDAHLHYIKNIM